jgi:hypothetical protein
MHPFPRFRIGNGALGTSQPIGQILLGPTMLGTKRADTLAVNFDDFLWHAALPVYSSGWTFHCDTGGGKIQENLLVYL